MKFCFDLFLQETLSSPPVRGIPWDKPPHLLFTSDTIIININSSDSNIIDINMNELITSDNSINTHTQCPNFCHN